MINLHHDTLLFNIHDLVLLLAVGQYLLLSALLLATRHSGDKSSYLLVGILLITALQALDTLFIWSAPLRHILLQWHPGLLFLGSFSYWLVGPLLLGYVKSVLYRGFRLHWRDWLHLAPALVMSVLLIQHYYLLPDTEKVALMTDLAFMWQPLMVSLITGWHLSVIIYGAICLVTLYRYRRKLHQHYANIESRQRSWLIWVVVGFMIIAVWRLTVHWVGPYVRYSIADIMGIASNYITFVFVNSLVFVSIRFTHLFSGINAETPTAERQHRFKDEHIQRVTRAMEQEQRYLMPDITIESLAQWVSLPEKTLSRLLNQHFGKNFFEYINSYRVDAAKRLLSDPRYREWSMMQVLAEAGFTSKSTFNAIFKQQVGHTPTQYRKLQSHAGI